MLKDVWNTLCLRINGSPKAVQSYGRIYKNWTTDHYQNTDDIVPSSIAPELQLASFEQSYLPEWNDMQSWAVQSSSVSTQEKHLPFHGCSRSNQLCAWSNTSNHDEHTYIHSYTLSWIKPTHSPFVCWQVQLTCSVHCFIDGILSTN